MTDYLARHPHVGMCTRTETQNFATDLYPSSVVERSIHGSVARATRRSSRGRRAASGSARRLSGICIRRRRPARSTNSRPEADAIVMLRNPIEALPSLHSQFVFVGIEEALALDEERESRRALTGRPLAIRSRSSGICPFPDGNVHVVACDDFRRDTLAACRLTCQFLGIDPGLVPETRP
jgi:hypothetical protein